MKGSFLEDLVKELEIERAQSIFSKANPACIQIIDAPYITYLVCRNG